MKKSFIINDLTGCGWRARFIRCPVCEGDCYQKLFKLVKAKCNPRRPADIFVRCKTCGLVYVNPRILFPSTPDNELSQPLPNDIDFDASLRLSDFELPEDLERIRKYRPTGRLLEIGCGTGAFLKLASEAGYQVMGIEPRSDYAVYARDKFGVDVIQGLVGDPRQSIELPTRGFDIVVMLAVIEHVLDVRKVVQEVQKCLRPGGIFYLMTPDGSSLSARMLGPRWKQYHVCWHHQFFNQHTLRRLLTGQGFRVLETWGVYRGRSILWKQMAKRVLAAAGISLDVISILAEKAPS